MSIKLTIVNQRAYLDRFEKQIAQWIKEIEIREEWVTMLSEYVFKVREKNKIRAESSTKVDFC